MLLGTASSDFLIPNGTFIAELIIFIVILGVVAKFILPTIQNAMDERGENIRASQRASDEGRSEADQLESDRREVLEGARAQARALLEDAGRQTETLFNEARERGIVEHDRLIAEAQPLIATERNQAREEILARVGDLVVAAAGQVVGAAVEVGKHRALIDETVARARADGGV